MRFMLLLSLAFGCVTPYQPNSFTGGYSDFKVGPDQYIVRFSGNGYTKYETVFSYALRRSDEVCKQNGFDGFQVIAKDGQTVTDKTSDTYSCTTTGSYGSYQSECKKKEGMKFYKSSVELLVKCLKESKEI